MFRSICFPICSLSDAHFTTIVRGPCPMLNTLANHGILPHSGKNLTQNVTVKALIDGVNFTPDLGAFLFRFALTTNPDSNATSFSLHQLGTHGILEHDASLRLFQGYCSITYKANSRSFLVVQISISMYPMPLTRKSSTRPHPIGPAMLSTCTKLPPPVTLARKRQSRRTQHSPSQV
jgi:hypothetical protein